MTHPAIQAGRVAVITGAASGIGLAAAKRFAGFGMSLVLVDLHGEGHAVAAARLDGHWLLLDNRRMAMVEDVNARIYRPLFVIDDAGLMRYSNMPQTVSLPDHAAPAMPANPQPDLIAAAN